ncbi:MAG TPA: hypothetical protein VMU37_04375 [Caulobacteraceae bacterium]|nr:hypothetical protein [Caulobacteraceae bacterium]
MNQLRKTDTSNNHRKHGRLRGLVRALELVISIAFATTPITIAAFSTVTGA